MVELFAMFPDYRDDTKSLLGLEPGRYILRAKHNTYNLIGRLCYSIDDVQKLNLSSDEITIIRYGLCKVPLPPYTSIKKLIKFLWIFSDSGVCYINNNSHQFSGTDEIYDFISTLKHREEVNICFGMRLVLRLLKEDLDNG